MDHGRYCQLCNTRLGTYCAPCTVMLGKSESAPIPRRRCEQCGAVLPPPRPGKAGGRLQRYCNRVCRDAAYYRRHHGMEEGDWVQDRLEWVISRQEYTQALERELREARAEIARLTALVEATGDEAANEGH
jgi:hypothetical protein